MRRHEFATPPLVTRRAFLGLLATAPLLGSCGTPSVLRQAGLKPVPPDGLPSAVPAPALQAGDQWQIRLREVLTGLTTDRATIRIAAVLPDGYAVAEEWQTRGRVEARYDRNLNLLRTQSLTFDPPFPRYSFPLAIGKTWSGEVLKRDVSPQRYGNFRQRVRASVRGWEQVIVSAGTFTALRIDISVDWNDIDVAQLVGTTAETIWYVPQLRHMAFYHLVDFQGRHEVNNAVLELESFRLSA